MTTAADEPLWSLVESRDRAFAKAHEAFQSLTREAREKNREIAEKHEEIQRLKAAATEKDEEIARLKQEANRKDDEIQMLTRAAVERLAIIEQLQASREYRVGMTLLHPWQVLRQKF